MPVLPSMLSEQAQQQLLDAAEQVLRQRLQDQTLLPAERSLLPALLQTGCCFVTLHRDNNLRGCIGAVDPYQALVDDVVEHTQAAAFHDPRFSPLQASELQGLELEISVLLPPQRLEVTCEQELLQALVPGEDGLILTDGLRRAVFLPQVWQQLPQAEQFVGYLKRKGGWRDAEWPAAMQASRFAVQAFKRQLD